MTIVTVTNINDENEIFLFHVNCFNRLCDNMANPHYHMTNEDEFIIAHDKPQRGESCLLCKKGFRNGQP